MPIINSSLKKIFTAPPRLNAQQADRLLKWMGVAYQQEPGRRLYSSQEEMLDSLIDAEKRAQTIKQRRSVLLDSIPELKIANKIDAIREVQQSATALTEDLRSLDYFRSAIKLVGDDIAHRIIGDPDIIKGFGLKERVGYVSGKSGLTSEIEAFNHFLSQGFVVLLNDLTHCVKAGDLTLRKGETLRFYEVKANPREYARPETQKQIVGPMIVQDYVKTDAMRVKLEDTDTVAIRLDGPSQDLHSDIGSQLLKHLGHTTFREVRRGAKRYLASRRSSIGLLRERVEDLTKSGDWVVSNLVRRVTHHHALPPFTQWFRADASIAIATGDIVVLTAYSLSDLRQLAEDQRVRVTWRGTKSDEFPMYFEPLESSELKLLDAGDSMLWHRLRIGYAFLAVESFVNMVSMTFSPDAISQLEKKRPLAQRKFPVTPAFSLPKDLRKRD